MLIFEYPCFPWSDKPDFVVFNKEHRPFPQASDPDISINLDEFLDALFSCFPGILLGIGIGIMGIYLKRDKAKCLERGWLCYGHIVYCADSRAGYIRSGAPVYILNPCNFRDIECVIINF
jgi:hypothetical protein